MGEQCNATQPGAAKGITPFAPPDNGREGALSTQLPSQPLMLTHLASLPKHSRARAEQSSRESRRWRLQRLPACCQEEEEEEAPPSWTAAPTGLSPPDCNPDSAC